MLIFFNEHFEYETRNNSYYVEVAGSRDIDVDSYQYTNLSWFSVFNDAGEELDDSHEIYNEIEEHVLYEREYNQESNGFDDEFSDEEEIPTYGISVRK